MVVKMKSGSVFNVESKWDKYLFRKLAILIFVFYVFWNLYWISNYSIPPSIFNYFTGLPCPTTGCTRSLNCLFNKEYKQFFLFNVCTVPYIVLIGLSFFSILSNYILFGMLKISNYLALSWWFTLSIGWFFKFLIGKNYW